MLPKRPNELWQTDVTYIRIPGYGWWYAITVIDYGSRYLLALHLTSGYSAVEVSHASRLARMNSTTPVTMCIPAPQFGICEGSS